MPRHALIGAVNPIVADEVRGLSVGTEHNVALDPVPGIATWAVDSLVTNQLPGVGERRVNPPVVYPMACVHGSFAFSISRCA